jgi:hypothetical protein
LARFSVVAVGLLLLVPIPARAAFMSGTEFVQDCRSQNYSFLGGYVAGLSDAHEAISRWEKFNREICPSRGVTVRQMVEVACRRLEQNPQDWHLSASSLMTCH